MKRTLAFALMIGGLSFAPNAVQAGNSGFYIGGILGLVSTDASLTATSGGGTASLSPDISGLDYGMSAGYRHFFSEEFFVDSEIDFAFSNADDSVGGLNFDKNHGYGLAIKPGYVIDSDVKVYGILGYRWAEYELSSGTASAEETFDGLSYGLGGEYSISDDYGIALEYHRVNYGSYNENLSGTNANYDGDENQFKLVFKASF
jgi:hypothetical protein